MCAISAEIFIYTANSAIMNASLQGNGKVHLQDVILKNYWKYMKYSQYRWDLSEKYWNIVMRYICRPSKIEWSEGAPYRE